MIVADLNTVQMHEACVHAADIGWSACVTSWVPGVAAVVSGTDRMRVILAEPATQCLPTNITRYVRLAAGRLLATGMPVGESLDALCLLTTRQLGSRTPGASLTLIDLFRSGRVDIAGRVAPPVLHVAMQDAVRPYTTHDGKSHSFAASSTDCLAAYLPTFVELVPTTVLARLPDYMRQQLGPCQIRGVAAAAVTASAGIRPGAIPPLMFAQRH